MMTASTKTTILSLLLAVTPSFAFTTSTNVQSRRIWGATTTTTRIYSSPWDQQQQQQQQQQYGDQQQYYNNQDGQYYEGGEAAAYQQGGYEDQQQQQNQYYDGQQQQQQYYNDPNAPYQYDQQQQQQQQQQYQYDQQQQQQYGAEQQQYGGYGQEQPPQYDAYGAQQQQSYDQQQQPYGVDQYGQQQQQQQQQQPPQQEESPSLFLGSEAEAKLESLKEKYPTNENAYLAAARSRSVDAKARYLAQIEAEDRAAEELRRKKEAEKEYVQSDYGPGDLSDFRGFENDGFEASEGNDESGGWGELREEEEPEEDEGPGLFIPGADDGVEGGSGLIL